MSGRRHTPEQIVAGLCRVDVPVSRGQTIEAGARSIGVTRTTCHCGRNEVGGLKLDQVRRLKELEAENQRLRGAVADLRLDKVILAAAARAGPPVGP